MLVLVDDRALNGRGGAYTTLICMSHRERAVLHERLDTVPLEAARLGSQPSCPSLLSSSERLDMSKLCRPESLDQRPQVIVHLDLILRIYIPAP